MMLLVSDANILIDFEDGGLIEALFQLEVELEVELFAVDLPAEAWPAPEAVALYFGRSGDENRFAQEDREIDLDRIMRTRS